MIGAPSPPTATATAVSGGGATAALAHPEQQEDEWDLLDKKQCSALAVLLLLRQKDEIVLHPMSNFSQEAGHA